MLANWLTPTSLFLLLNIMIATIFFISRLSPPKRSHHEFEGGGGYSSAAPPLQRAPSLIERVKSINLSSYKFPSPSHHDVYYNHNPVAHPLERAPSIIERVKSINFSLYKFSPRNPDHTEYIPPTEDEYTNTQPSISRAPSLLERVKSIDFTSFYRSDSEKEPDLNSDTSPVHSQMKRIESESKVNQRKIPEKMKKSASENSRRKAEEEDDEEEEEEEEEEVERRRPVTTRIEKTTSFADDDQGVDAKADDFINKFRQQLKLQRLDSLLRYKDMLKRQVM